ncbi:MAG TPA: tetratricopeptide repeat protein, partial [Vicinamibacteria bacterium]
ATLSDLADQLEAVFIRLGEAYETLKNPRQRADYEARLSRERARMEAAAGGAPGVPVPAAQAGSSAAPSDPEEDRKAAEDAVRKGAYLFEKEKYYDAIQLLEPAIEVLTGKVQARGRLVLAKAYLKNPNWVKRAEETLLSIVHDDGKNVDRTLDPMRTEAYYLLGTIYRERGLMSRATTMFRKVLELKPDHEEALAEVGPPAVEEEPAPEKGRFWNPFRKG